MEKKKIKKKIVVYKMMNGKEKGRKGMMVIISHKTRTWRHQMKLSDCRLYTKSTSHNAQPVMPLPQDALEAKL